MRRVINIKTGNIIYENKPTDTADIISKLTSLETKLEQNKFDISLVKNQQVTIEATASNDAAELLADVNRLRLTVNAVSSDVVDVKNSVTNVSITNDINTTELASVKTTLSDTVNNIYDVNSRLDIIENSNNNVIANIVDSGRTPESIIIYGQSDYIYMDDSLNHSTRLYNINADTTLEYNTDNNTVRILKGSVYSNLVTLNIQSYDYIINIFNDLLYYYDNTILYFNGTDQLIQINTENNLFFACLYNNNIYYVDTINDTYSYDLSTSSTSSIITSAFDSVFEAIETCMIDSVIYFIYKEEYDTVVLSTNDMSTFNTVYRTSTIHLTNINIRGLIEYLSDEVYSYSNRTNIINQYIQNNENYYDIGFVNTTNYSIQLVGRSNTAINGGTTSDTLTATNGTKLKKSSTTTNNVDITIKKTNENADYILSVIDQDNNAVMLVDNNKLLVVNHNKDDYIDVSLSIQDLNNTLQSNTNRISDLEDNNIVLNNKVQSNTSRISDLEDNNIVLNNKVNVLEDDVDIIQNDIINTNNAVNSLNDIVTGAIYTEPVQLTYNDSRPSIDNTSNTITVNVDTDVNAITVVNNTNQILNYTDNTGNLFISNTDNTGYINVRDKLETVQPGLASIPDQLKVDDDDTVEVYTKNGVNTNSNQYSFVVKNINNTSSNTAFVNNANQIVAEIDNDGSYKRHTGTTTIDLNSLVNQTANDLIDTNGVVAGHTSSIASLNTRVGTAETNISTMNTNLSNTTTKLNNYTNNMHYSDGDVKSSSMLYTVADKVSYMFNNETSSTNVTFFSEYTASNGTTYVIKMVFYVETTTTNPPVVTLHDSVTSRVHYTLTTDYVYTTSYTGRNMSLFGKYVDGSTTYYYFRSSSNNSSFVHILTVSNTSTFNAWYSGGLISRLTSKTIIPSYGIYFIIGSSIRKHSTFQFTNATSSTTELTLPGTVISASYNLNLMYIVYSVDSNNVGVRIYDYTTEEVINTVIFKTNAFNGLIGILSSEYLNNSIYMAVDRYSANTNNHFITNGCMLYKLDLLTNTISEINITPKQTTGSIDIYVNMDKFNNNILISFQGLAVEYNPHYTKEVPSVIAIDQNNNINNFQLLSIVNSGYNSRFFNNLNFVDGRVILNTYTNRNNSFLEGRESVYELFQTKTEGKDNIFTSGDYTHLNNSLAVPNLIYGTQNAFRPSTNYRIHKIVYHPMVGLMNISLQRVNVGTLTAFINHIDNPMSCSINRIATASTDITGYPKLVNHIPMIYKNKILFVIMENVANLVDQAIYAVVITLNSDGNHTMTVNKSALVNATGPFKLTVIRSYLAYIQSANSIMWSFNVSTNSYTELNGESKSLWNYQYNTSSLDSRPFKEFTLGARSYRIISMPSGLAYEHYGTIAYYPLITHAGTIGSPVYELIDDTLFMITPVTGNVIRIDKYRLSIDVNGSSLVATLYGTSPAIASPYTNTTAVTSCVVGSFIYIQPYGSTVIGAVWPSSTIGAGDAPGIWYNTVTHTLYRVKLSGLYSNSNLFVRKEGHALVIFNTTDMNAVGSTVSSNLVSEYMFIPPPNIYKANPLHINIASGTPILVTDGKNRIFEVTYYGDIITPYGSMSNIMYRLAVLESKVPG